MCRTEQTYSEKVAGSKTASNIVGMSKAPNKAEYM